MRVSNVLKSGLVGLTVCLMVSTGAASALAKHDGGHPGACGPQARPYACGQILVVLNDPPEPIEAVMSRLGADPVADLAGQFAAVRDILDPDGEADDTSPTTVYIVLVAVGSEEATAQRYADDVAVYAASVDRETIGTLTPDTAVGNPSGSSPRLVGLTLVVLACALLVRAMAGRRLRTPGAVSHPESWP